MAEFIYNQNVRVLKFGEHTFELPLNETTAELFGNTVIPLLKQKNPQNIDDVNKVYDEGMDAIDAILGVGAADKAIEGFKHAGVLEVFSIISYIYNEFKEGYAEAVEELKKTAHFEPQPINRAQRRARR